MYACLRLQSSPGDVKGLLLVASDFSPRLKRVGDGEVLLDVSGLGRLIGPPDEIQRQLACAVEAAGIQANVAIAPTMTAARLLATQWSDYPIERLPDLPVALLQPLEAGVKDGATEHMNDRDRERPYETLERWGIATLGDLADLPAAELSSRLGRRGVALQRLAQGLDPAPFVPDGEAPRFVGHLELDWPIDALEPLSFVFARLLEPLAAALERADRGAAAVRLDLRLTDRSTHSRVLQLPVAMRDPRVLRTLLLLDLESNPPSSPLRGAGEASSVTAAVDIVTIELDPAPSRITQFSLLQRALPSPETLATLTARLSALMGESRVGSAVLRDSHRPDAFAMRPYAPEERGAWGARGAEVPGGEVPGAEVPGGEGPGAEEPGGEGRGLDVLRRQRVPIAICVSAERGRPVHIAASRRGVPCGLVIQAAGPWRISGGWWGENSWNRNEWDIALKSGVVCRIYQDRTTQRWFFDGLYD